MLKCKKRQCPPHARETRTVTHPTIVFLDAFTLAIAPNAFAPIRALGELVVYDRTRPAEVVERAAPADVVLTNKAPLTAQSLVRLERLKFIGVTATGYNVVDTAATAARSICVSNVPEYGTDTVAQHAIAMLLELCNRVGLHDQSVHRGDWVRSGDWSYTVSPLVELRGKCLGIVGFGRIGRKVGEIAAALGMAVSAIRGRTAPPDVPYPVTWLSPEELFAQSHVVTLHCPLTESTKGMVDGSRLRMMKPDAMLINCARGGIVVERDLADALNAGIIAGAAVDVASEEPINPDNPLLGARNCVLTPHIAWATNEAKARLIQSTADNIAAFLAGRPINVVNR
jgi:glycerate dehydrogenase